MLCLQHAFYAEMFRKLFNGIFWNEGENKPKNRKCAIDISISRTKKLTCVITIKDTKTKQLVKVETEQV